MDRGHWEGSVNKTEARKAWGAAYGGWYWANRHKNNPAADWAHKTKAERVALILDIRKYRVLMRTAPPEVNGRGNQIYRNEDADRMIGGGGRGAERYIYDFKLCTPELGWKQFDTHQDASYFGVWVNIQQRMTFAYCEGDRTLVVCPDDDHLRAELKDAEEFYGAPPPMAIGFDMDGTRTEYYDTRPTL
jgi:hypothetical protein